MPEEINIVSIGDVRHRYKGEIIQSWDFDYSDSILRIDFKDGSYVEYYKQNIICVEYVKHIEGRSEE